MPHFLFCWRKEKIQKNEIFFHFRSFQSSWRAAVGGRCQRPLRIPARVCRMRRGARQPPIAEQRARAASRRADLEAAVFGRRISALGARRSGGLGPQHQLLQPAVLRRGHRDGARTVGFGAIPLPAEPQGVAGAAHVSGRGPEVPATVPLRTDRRFF